jgi:hexosaminidase
VKNATMTTTKDNKDTTADDPATNGADGGRPPMMKFVHVDLKGARPQLQYWINFCRLLRDWGDVDGLVIEWEDSYPLDVLKMYNQSWVYTREEATRMAKVAEDCGLRVIPLCQTFGHLEYVLKHFSHLREHPERPDCLIPVESFTDESFGIVTQLIDDVFDICPNAPAIHLGGDEVWHLGSGIRSQERMDRGEMKGDLYLKHYSFVIDYILRKYPGKRILLWDDMLRAAPMDVLNKFEYGLLRDHVELVVWQYAAQPDQYLPSDLLDRYKSIFRQGLWAGTAYKGATSSCALIPTVSVHVANHLGWQDLLKKNKDVAMNGYILTGWQRYDHFASLCEFLPVAIPCLRCCLTALKKGKFDRPELAEARILLGMPDIPMEVYPRPQAIPSDVSTFKFPGADVYVLMQRFVNAQCSAKSLLAHDAMTTWFSSWHVANGRISLLQIRVIINNVKLAIEELQYIEKCLQPVLNSVFDKATVEEWFGTYSDPLIKELGETRDRGFKVLDDHLGPINQATQNPDDEIQSMMLDANTTTNNLPPFNNPTNMVYDPPLY